MAENLNKTINTINKSRILSNLDKIVDEINKSTISDLDKVTKIVDKIKESGISDFEKSKILITEIGKHKENKEKLVTLLKNIVMCMDTDTKTQFNYYIEENPISEWESPPACRVLLEIQQRNTKHTFKLPAECPTKCFYY